jgi:hypothetical protein
MTVVPRTLSAAPCAPPGMAAPCAPPGMAASIILSNFNYAPYLAAAIDSALAVRWPDLEIIVVDDGSTDASREIISAYGSRVTAVFQENRGQREAYAAGFARSRGEMVIFLDSDDLLDPEILQEAARMWGPQVSKVQVQMQVIDKAGQPTGSIFPPFYKLPTPAYIRRWMVAAGAYPTPPGSGNIFSRSLLNRIFPITDLFDYAGDSYTLAAAPMLGDVVTIVRPLASYRVHGRNDGAMTELDDRRFAAELQRAHARHAYACAMGHAAGLYANPDAVRLSISSLPYRAASFRLTRASHPVAGDGRLRIFRDAAQAVCTPQGVTLSSRLTTAVWLGVVLLAPLALARRLILWRFVPAARPAGLRRVLTRLHVVR